MKALENEINQYEFKLNKIPDEYNTSTLCEWPVIREKEIYFIRKLAKLKKTVKERELNDKKYKTSVVINKWEDESNPKDIQSHKAKRDPETHKCNIMIDNVLKEERQLEFVNKLLERYEDEDNNAQQYRDLIDSLDDDSLYNLDNAMDASEIKSDRISTLGDVKTELMDQGNCDHDWIQGRGDYNIKCAFCIYYPSQENRFTCSIYLKQACASCLKAGNQRWRQEVELEAEDKLLARRVRNLENRINSLEVELEELRSKIELSEVQKAEEKAGKNIEL